MRNMAKKVIVTSSREPSRRTRSFLKDIEALAPWIIRVNRGKMTFQELVVIGIEEKAETLLLVGERRGNPSIIRIYDLTNLDEENNPLHAYTFFLKGIVLSREMRTQHSELEPKNIILEARPAIDETERELILGLYKMFGTSNVVYDKTRIHEALRIVVSRGRGYYKVHFKYGARGTRVGPLIKIEGVKRIGKHVRPH
jgi:U3 small nucleolar ribonucleoprotein protein IMP4